MYRTRVLPAAVSLTAAAALLLTGCGGGGDDKDKEPIEGAGGESKSSAPASPSASAGPEIDRPELTLPSDVKIVTDWVAPSDPKKAVVLNDSVNFLRAINLAVTKQTSTGAAYKFYVEPVSPAQDFAKNYVDNNVKKGYSLSGTERLSKPKVTILESGRTAVVALCADDSKFYSKEVKTGKVLRTEESASSYTYLQIAMSASKTTEGLWRAKDVKAEGSAKQCR